MFLTFAARSISPSLLACPDTADGDKIHVHLDPNFVRVRRISIGARRPREGHGERAGGWHREMRRGGFLQRFGQFPESE